MLADEPGLGKTAQLLLAAQGRTLVVGAARYAPVWEVEHKCWAPDLDMTYAPLSRLGMRRKTAAGGYELLPRLRAEYAQHWDTILVDEAHHLRGRNAQQTKLFEKLNSERIYLASGTPVPSWAHELFITARLLHPGDRRFSSYWRWADTWFRIWKSHWGSREVGGLKRCTKACKQERACHHWIEFHEENLGPLYLGRTWNDVGIELPPMIESQLPLEMVPAQRRAYASMRKSYIADVTGHVIQAWNDGKRASAMMQMTTGLEIATAGERKGSNKLAALSDALEERSDQATLVFARLRRTAVECAKVAERLGLPVTVATGADSPDARARAVVNWQQGGGPGVLIGTIATISESYTLTRATSAHFVERSWLPSDNAQARRRISRLGQTKPTLAVDYVSLDSVDAKMLPVLARKTDQQMRALRPRELAGFL